MASTKTRSKVAGRSTTAPRSHLGARRPERYDMDSWVAKAETATGEWAKDVAHRGRQAQRLVYKKRKKVKEGKGKTIRVAGRGAVVVGRGAAGAAVSAVAGTYLTVRWTARHANRARKWASPHVRRAANHVGRAAYSNAVVYGDAAARRAVRMRARNRTRMRKMRTAAAVRLDQASTHAISRGWNRTGRAALRAAAVVAPPTTRNALFRAMRATPAAAVRAEEEAMAKAREVLNTPKRKEPRGPAGQSRTNEQIVDDLKNRTPGDVYVPGWKGDDVYVDYTLAPERKKTDSTTDSGPEQGRRVFEMPSGATAEPRSTAGGGESSDTRTPNGAATRGGPMATDPIALIQRGFQELAEFQPEDYYDWIQMLMRLSGALRMGAEGITVLSVRMDVIEKMDPRALEKLYMSGMTIAVAMQLSAGATKDFMKLYRDRFEKDGERGRTMRDESSFFGA
jgi:hypothetical protein